MHALRGARLFPVAPDHRTTQLGRARGRATCARFRASLSSRSCCPKTWSRRICNEQAPTAGRPRPLLLLLQACGGGGAGSSTPPPPPPLPSGTNVAPLIVDAGPSQSGVNLPSVSVKFCEPGTTTCQTIDHILVDTGSSGLRIVASALTTSTPIAGCDLHSGDPFMNA